MQAPMPPPKPPEVDCSVPIVREETEYEYFTGQTQAMQTIEVRARVSGYLSKVYFKEGAEVKQGDKLFEIDPRPYQADLAQAEANLVQAESHYRRLGLDADRASKLNARGAMSREDYDKIMGDRAEADAAVGSARASRDRAKLNLDFTQVAAPISGRISRRFLDPWNMVKADETPLTTVVSQDPIYVYFDVDEANVLRQIRLAGKGKIKWEPNMPVRLGLGDDEGFPHEGTVDFVDNQVDVNTGTLRMRGVFPNPDRLLTPGLFARIRLPIGRPHQAVLVAEQALVRDQGQKYLYVVNAKDEVEEEKKNSGEKFKGIVEYRPVKVGRLYDGLREVTGDLTVELDAKGNVKGGDRVIVTGMQRVRDKVPVEAKQVAMPKPTPGGKGAARKDEQ
jgi:RND family efflux transporter MFP subunit